jgi:NADH:ubiquinone oxidoreductase subunit 6 (subunit J)
MLTTRIEDKAIQQVKQLLPSLLAVFVLFAIFIKVLLKGPWAQAKFTNAPLTIEGIGRALMTQYVVPFEFMSVILLAAMVGAIVIGKDKR